ncbi:mitochondrial carrier domain-containing protein [Jimgerdemannia flammicorona]|uniref:Mitochondrial carrier domain-containing protein n=1 Tax=Jimgerdemannia flammicorona TaxID=994334 RepID=A0A433R030_9FUNG|nr:mitochondrial carrier domain-containing protein [Jimgerdemannia flammicorona]
MELPTSTSTVANPIDTVHSAATLQVGVQPQPFLSKNTKDTLVGFILGGVAACGAVTFTNPWEVVKTRLQLQGELVRAGNLAETARPYRNSFQALVLVFRHEGIRGIQRGLGSAYVYQICLNGTRLGLYEPIRNGINDLFSNDHSNNNIPVRIASGGISGICGAAIGSPFYLVKTRMQSYSPSFSQIGHQHHYTSIYNALSSVFRAEGVRGLYRGIDAAMARAGVGSAVQLPTYDMTKQVLRTRFGMGDNFSTHFASSLICGFFVCCAMNPFDVISTRMYNQKMDPVTGQGVLYKNPLDCVAKMLHTEGVAGLYKGFSAHYLRIGPHTVLMFIFLEQLKRAYHSQYCFVQTKHATAKPPPYFALTRNRTSQRLFFSHSTTMTADQPFSEQESYYQWLHLRFDWRGQCEGMSPLVRKTVEDFFEPAIFFGEGTQTARTQFLLGTSQFDGRRYVLLSELVALQLRSLLTNLLNRKITLTEPKTYSHTYHDLQPIVFESKKVYFKTMEKLKNINKAIKTKERLENLQSQWHRAAQLVSEKKYIFLSVDIEAWERDHSRLLEIGWTLYDSQREQLQDQHYLISDYRHLTNGSFVADRKQNFMFGTSVWSTLQEALHELNKDLAWAVDRDGGVVLVGHDLKSDIVYLEKVGVMCGESNENVVGRFDTAEIYAAKNKEPNNRASLGKALDGLEMENWCLHNAGNDAHYTMELFLKLCDLLLAAGS